MADNADKPDDESVNETEATEAKAEATEAETPTAKAEEAKPAVDTKKAVEKKPAEKTADEKPAAPRPKLAQGSIGSPIHNTFVIAKREFISYFASPLGYIVIGMFLLLVGFLMFYPFAFLVIGRASLQPLFNSIAWLMPLIAPAIAMRTFAEESRTGTLEMLITQPVRDWEVIVGKFLGAMGLLAICLVATLSYPLAVSRMGQLDAGPVWGGYLGLLLAGGAYVSFGVMVSSYTKDQITAFFGAFIISALLFLLNKALIFFGQAAPVLEYICPDYHYTLLSRGVIDLRNILYFVSVIFVTLLATARSLDSRRWS